MNLKQRKEWAKKLKPYWKNREMHYDIFRQAEFDLENKMKKELGENLEFIYGDMDFDCIGIGHSDFSKRKKFPLFQINDLECQK